MALFVLSGWSNDAHAGTPATTRSAAHAVLSSALLAEMEELPAESAPAEEPAVTSAKDPARGAKRMRTAGLILTIAGIPVAAIGIVVGIAGFVIIYASDEVGVFAFGGILVGVGILSLVSGIPLWIIGGTRARKLKKSATAAALAPFVTPIRGGAIGGLTMRF